MPKKIRRADDGSTGIDLVTSIAAEVVRQAIEDMTRDELYDWLYSNAGVTWLGAVSENPDGLASQIIKLYDHKRKRKNKKEG